jgi:hypothetical protein
VRKWNGEGLTTIARGLVADRRRTVIAPLSKPVRDYLSEFNLGCILVSSTGEIQVVGANHLARMSSVAALWWTQDRATAHQVVRAIGEQRPGSLEKATAEILAAAKRIDAVLSEHSTVLARAQAALSQLDGKLAAAQRAGDLKFFNQSYRQYRLDCKERGEHGMPYNVALAKLRKILAGAAAGAQVPDLVAAVFER